MEPLAEFIARDFSPEAVKQQKQGPRLVTSPEPEKGKEGEKFEAHVFNVLLAQRQSLAKRWLIRWLSEAEKPTIDVAAELAAVLADGKAEPQAMQCGRSKQSR